MDIVWNLKEEDREIKVKLVYNVYLGIKKLYVDSKEIIKVISFRRNSDINFEYDGKEYKVQLINDGYDYIGYLLTPEGETVPSEVKNKVVKKTPLWIIPFVIINMSIPILSTETLTTWIIGIGASYGTAKVSQKSEIDIKKRVAISIVIAIIAWGLYFLFYKAISGVLASNDGFLPRKK